MTLVRDECCDVEMRFREYVRVAAVDAYNTAERWSLDPAAGAGSDVLHEVGVAAALLEMVREVVGDEFSHTCCGVDLLQFGVLRDAVRDRVGGGGAVLPVFPAVFVGDVRLDADRPAEVF